MIRLFLTVIGVIIFILIKIGDSVLFLFFLPTRLIHALHKLSNKSVPLIKKRGRPIRNPAHEIFVSKARRTPSLFTKIKYFFFGTLFSFIFFFLPLLLYVFIQNLPNPKTLVTGQIPLTTKIYDRNRTLLYQIYAAQNRTLVPLSDIPPYLQQATIAIEDKDFYSHPGFDITAIIRSLIENLSGKSLQGGSTITQQLIKSSLLSPEASFFRKIKEVILAFWAEHVYTKKQILELYLNYVPYGGTAWGVESASEVYFGKHVKDLTLAESAFLAGVPRAPTIYSPFGTTPNAWKKRQKEVLERMEFLGYITKDQKNAAQAEELVFESARIPINAPHFVMYVRDLLVKKYGLAMVEKGGLSVTTSLDLSLQNTAQGIVTKEVEANAQLSLTNGAALITDPTNGDILAMIGSKSFSDPVIGNVNLTTSLRQPGSSIKVVTYAAALSNGFTASSIIDDSPITYSSPGAPSYSPVNYDGKFHGRVSLRTALGNSFNIPAVKTLNQIGIPTFVTFAKKMGVKSWNNAENYGLAITLGAAETTMLDMATVYGVLANSGTRQDLNPILKITDNNGTIIEAKHAEEEGEKVLSDGVSFIISDILADNNARALAFGTNSLLNIPNYNVSVKTGTSDNKRDNWAIGYTKNRLVAVWVGNNDNTPMSQYLASGVTGAAPIWNKIITTIVIKQPNDKPEIPENVVQKPCNGKIEYFVRGTETAVNCSFSRFPSRRITPTKTP